MCHASLGVFGLTFTFAGRADTHEFNQIGHGFAPSMYARVERASIFKILIHAWLSVHI